MNCPSRVDPEALPNGWNQNPSSLDLHKNGDLNGIANLRHWQDHRIASEQPPDESPDPTGRTEKADKAQEGRQERDGSSSRDEAARDVSCKEMEPCRAQVDRSERPPHDPERSWFRKSVDIIRARVVKFSNFVGPGFMIAVAYIDPGNYATDVAAGATYRFRLLVMIMVSNLIAIFLQSLCIKLGSVTGMNLSENVRAHCPRWLNYILYLFAEAAIIATDIAEVLGTAIALNLLIHIPLVAGCAISIVDVLIILIFYRPSGSIKGLRWFEVFIMVLVLGVVICFSVELSLIHVDNIGDVFRGYLPSSVLVESQGLYQACGILGATVMPHSLYLGSGIVQPRLKNFDDKHDTTTRSTASLTATDNEHPPEAPEPTPSSPNCSDETKTPTTTATPTYRPSLAAIKHCMATSIVELTLSLATFALFVNSSILIVAGATLHGTDSEGDAGNLFSIHALFARSLAPFAGTVFALALLLSGTSAGIICTIAGQMVSEGQLGWKVKPWIRRLITRSISITPSIIVAGAVGKEGVSKALEGTQVALSVILPFVSAPLIYFTCRERYMKVVDEGQAKGWRSMRNGWFVGILGTLLWLLIVVMNVALLVLAGKGVE